jgi:hypothetical protein
MKILGILLIVISGLVSGCVAYDTPYRGEGRGYNDGIRGDRDRDGIPNRMDRDRDGDGVPNRQDRRPDDPRRY